MTTPRYMPEDDTTILRLRAEGWRWVLITLALDKGHTPTGVEKRWQKLILSARIEAAEAEDAARPKVRMVVPGIRDPQEPQPKIKSYWPDGWTIKPPTKAQLMGKK